MAKRSVVIRNTKRRAAAAAYAERRQELKKKVIDPTLNLEQKMEAMMALQKLPRDGSPCRIRNRCGLTGRPRGYYRRFGLSRNKLREVIMKGQAPGVTKASW